jgi:GTP-binding protein
MLTDEVTFQLKAGDGGKGAVAFNKVRLSLGPTGADGGRGGNIYFEGVTDIMALGQYSARKEIKGENGKDGRGQFIDGRDGEDTILKIPIGTTITNLETNYKQEMVHVGQRILAAGGGVGGRGNFKYRSSTNTSPKEFDYGTAGDTVTYRLTLRLIADIGLVGLPNAGKSSLLNELTGAHSRVASYAFTTLEPSLGAYYGIVLADIPGLIEGASAGKGLGHKFLKHIERTRVLFHLISAESEDPVADYRVIRKELEVYNSELMEKKEYVFLTKSDMVSPEELEKKLKALKKIKLDPKAISILDEGSMEVVKRIINDIKEERERT